MKTLRILSILTALVCGIRAQAQGYAPLSVIGNTILNSTLMGSTDGANANGSFSDLLSVNGRDYTVTSAGALALPAPYTYMNTGANTGVITESGVTVSLTFASVDGGTFSAAYPSGATQTGSFTLNSLGVPTGLNSLVQGNALINVSDLMHLDAGASSTVGFVIGGSTPASVLVRAAGPSLSQFGVTGTLATPTLALLSTGGTLVATNTSWNNAANLSAAFSSAGAFAFTPGSADSAIITTLAPGAYTAQVKSTSSTDSGNVLVEVYVLP